MLELDGPLITFAMRGSRGGRAALGVAWGRMRAPAAWSTNVALIGRVMRKLLVGVRNANSNLV